MPLPKLLAVASLHSHLANEQLEQLTNSLQGLIKVDSRWVDAISRPSPVEEAAGAGGRHCRSSSHYTAVVRPVAVSTSRWKSVSVVAVRRFRLHPSSRGD